jgi:hypothetical protein
MRTDDKRSNQSRGNKKSHANPSHIQQKFLKKRSPWSWIDKKIGRFFRKRTLKCVKKKILKIRCKQDDKSIETEYNKKNEGFFQSSDRKNIKL